MTIFGQRDVTPDHVFTSGCVVESPKTREEHDFARISQQNRGGSSPSATKKVSHNSSEITVSNWALKRRTILVFTLSLAYRDAKPDGVDITAAGELSSKTPSVVAVECRYVYLWVYLYLWFTS